MSELSPPAADLRGSLQDTLSDPVEVMQWAPGLTLADTERAARILERLAEECAEAAAMTRALPGRPPGAPGHSFAAIAAVSTAATAEHDFGGWLSVVLAHAAVRSGGSGALVRGRPDSRESGLVLALASGSPRARREPGE